MNSTTMAILIVLVTATWLLTCTYLYRSWRSAAWLAGSTAAAALFFTGAAMACSVMVHGSHFLAPVWLGMVAVLLMHVRAALQNSRPEREEQEPVACPVAVKEDLYI